MRKWSIAAAVVFVLAGCSSMPTTGPSTETIVGAKQSDSVPEGIHLVDIDAAVARIVESFRTTPLSGRFADRRPSPVQTIGIGDKLGVTLFEASAGGLFSTSNGQIGGGTKHVALPPQDVGPSGTINVPYVGRLVVNGRTADQIEKIIVDGLRDKAIEPQAVVTLESARSSLVSVNGEVHTAGRIPLSPRGDRLMDVLATAGGTKGEPNELFVRMTRNGSTGAVPLRTILEDPAQNIWVWPGDQLFVYREPQTFTAFGATGKSGNFPLIFERTALVEAIGAASGLNDDRAEPAGVFVYRQERADLVCALKGERPCAAPSIPRPIVYRLNLRAAEGIALAQRIPVRNKDVVYVANANAAELLKFLRIIGTAGGFANQSVQSAGRVENF